MPLTGWLVDRVARIPTRVQTKLLAAFLAIAALLIMAGAVGLQALRGVNERTEELIHLQRKIEAYRQVQHDTTSQLYSVSSALLSSDDSTLSSTLRHLNQFGYDADRLQFVAKDEVDLLEEFQRQYGRFVEIVTHVVELIRAGRAGEARELQVTQATPLADRLERLTNQLVNKAEADMVAGIDARTQAYETARWIVIALRSAASRWRSVSAMPSRGRWSGRSRRSKRNSIGWRPAISHNASMWPTVMSWARSPPTSTG